MNRLHSLWAPCALALMLLIPANADAQQLGTVYLTDGSVLTGQIVEFVPGDHITLQIGTLAPIVVPQASIARVEIGHVAPQQRSQSPQAYALAEPPPPHYQLQQPYVAPARRAPRLGLPIGLLAAGGMLAIAGSTLIFVSQFTYASDCDYGCDYDDVERDYALFFPGIALATTSGILLTMGASFLAVRIRQRRRWSEERRRLTGPQVGFAPIIAPERELYGVQGTVSF